MLLKAVCMFRCQLTSQGESSHFRHRCLSRVQTFVEDVCLVVALDILDLLDGSEAVELFPQEVLGTPATQGAHPHLGGGVHFAVTDLALELADVLTRQLRFGTVSLHTEEYDQLLVLNSF